MEREVRKIKGQIVDSETGEVVKKNRVSDLYWETVGRDILYNRDKKSRIARLTDYDDLDSLNKKRFINIKDRVNNQLSRLKINHSESLNKEIERRLYKFLREGGNKKREDKDKVALALIHSSTDKISFKEMRNRLDIEKGDIFNLERRILESSKIPIKRSSLEGLLIRYARLENLKPEERKKLDNIVEKLEDSYRLIGKSKTGLALSTIYKAKEGSDISFEGLGEKYGVSSPVIHNRVQEIEEIISEERPSLEESCEKVVKIYEVGERPTLEESLESVVKVAEIQGMYKHSSPKEVQERLETYLNNRISSREESLINEITFQVKENFEPFEELKTSNIAAAIVYNAAEKTRRVKQSYIKSQFPDLNPSTFLKSLKEVRKLN